MQKTIAPFAVISIGEIVRIDARGLVWVRSPGTARPQAARLTSTITRSMLDQAFREKQAVALALDTEESRPLILGFIVDRLPTAPEQDPCARQVLAADQLELQGRESVTISCGRASITLTKAGKILLRGDYVLSQSTGANRLKGASVQIN